VFDTFYKLTGQPFLLTPDTRFFFGSSGHSRAIAHLVYGLSQQEGFIVITGEVGAGKTTLVEQLWAQLDRSTYIISRVVTTQVSGEDLFRLALANFGIDEAARTDRQADKATLLRRFEQLVREQRKQGRRCLLVIDEVQNLSLAAMEELRMLSNITVDGRASVQTILLGQPQFRPILASKDVEQLRQRVLASYHLGPLTDVETRGYIEHRMRTVGWTGDPVWGDEAFAAVHRQSGGIPRRINTLCSRVLLLGSLEEAHSITAAMVDATAEELDRDLGWPRTETAAETPAAEAVAPGSPAAPAPLPMSNDEHDDMMRRIEMLERSALRQEQAFRRVIDLLEANMATKS
jgi:putative secretion ATPase (PEP-CTERM system associated)